MFRVDKIFKCAECVYKKRKCVKQMFRKKFELYL